MTTVNELIAELQALSAQGHGELDVVGTEIGDCGDETTMLSLELRTLDHQWHDSYWKPLSNWRDIKEWDKTESIRDKPYVYISVNFRPDD